MTRLPAEWEKQAAVLIAWPHKTGDFGGHLDAVEQSYRVIANTINRYQTLIIVCKDSAHQQHIARLLQNDSAGIHYIHADYNDIWVRDTVFLSVEKAGKTQLLNFQFNGWGNKYPHAADDALNHVLLNHPSFQGLDLVDIDWILEGGSIESDGQGTVLTTRQCLLNPNRNPGLSQQDIEHRLSEYLGAKRVLWLSQEHLAGDDTDAHIDTLARFCNADTIAYSTSTNPADAHYASLKYMEAQLQAFRTVTGEPYKLIPLALPEPIFDEDGRRLPANYANFLIINDAVLMPCYDDPMDENALTQLRQGFSNHEVMAVACKPIVHQYGSLHCMTMQFPASLADFDR
ncbi:MAG: agmatine deiminase [Gammaproteobacteria bacterium HGW-Gammaproteobacteria-3]|nr:MAG: agmatine deiminase [Gammaproteobacteria bacterium HGW-Gammaproteobacteria-3]